MAVGRERAATSPSDKRLQVKSKTALMVFDAIEAVRVHKTQAQIAEEAGFFNKTGEPMANIIAMFKMGKTRIPIDKIGSIAKAIGLKPSKLFESAYKEYYPEAWLIVKQMIKEKARITEIPDNQVEILQFITELLGENTPELNDRVRDGLTKVLK